MIKLKKLIKEAYAWERKFGEKLPTLDSVQNKHQKKVNEGKDIFKTKIKGMEKNTITFTDEPHEDGTYFGVRVNNTNVGVIIVSSDGNIHFGRHKDKVKLK